MANYFIETRTYNPWWNLAVEKYLADRIGPGDVLLYLWQNDRTVVIGRNQNALRECRVSALEEDGGFLARRTTGGGAVYHDLGNLCFTFAASPECYDLTRQMKVIQDACRTFGIETRLSGRNDIITEEGFKFSGNAFSVTSRCKIQHGTIMVDVDTAMLGRYLTPSKEKLKAKGVKSVQSRVCNLNKLADGVTTDAMRKALKDAFLMEYGDFTELSTEGLDNPEVRETYEKYASWEWKYGKSPALETSVAKKFDWGEVEIWVTLKQMTVDSCKVYTDALDVELPQILENALQGVRFDAFDEMTSKKLDEMEKNAGLSAELRKKAQEALDYFVRELNA